MAEQEIGREREQAEDEHLRGEPHPERPGHERQHERRGERDEEDGGASAVHQASLPAMPRGRTRSSTAIGANSTKYENSGSSQRP